jgi:ABC-type sugar transport system ATPase subunit
MNTSAAGHGVLLEARDIAKSFGQTPALRGASMAVA